jgi:hypothetical protein
MSAPRDPDAILADWLEEGPTVLPEPTRRAIVVATRTTNRSRRPFWMPQRRVIMNTYARLAVAAVAIVVVLGGAVYLFAPRAGVGGGPPATAAPSATPSAAPSAVASPSPAASALGPLDTTGWTIYTSARYGFSIGHPADWMVLPSNHVWVFPADVVCCPPPAAESFATPANDVGVSIWSAGIKAGTTGDTWIQAYCKVMESESPCTDLQTHSIATSMDGHAGRLVLFAADTQAFIQVGNRMYVVACWRPESDPTVAQFGGARRLIEGYLSTMHLVPGGPASPAPSVTPRPS